MIGRFYNLKVDIENLKPNIIYTGFLFSKNDINSSFINIELFNKNVPIDLKNITVILAHKEGNYEAKFYEIPKENIINNTVIVPLPFEEKDEIGTNIFSLMLKNENQKIYTQSYSYRII